MSEWINRIHEGDSLEVLQELPENHVHAVVTDPPYGLAFMGRDWDTFEPKEYQEWCENWARRTKRVLKPGGHLLAFSGNRTHHRLFSGVEDAGFEIRDTLTWHYGSGFPKALDVSKAIDKQAGVEGEFTTNGTKTEGNAHLGQRRVENTGINGSNYEPATPEAEAWDGFKTALKPATEFIVLARKPLGEDTVAANVLEYGTGALNIDGTRIGTDEDTSRKPASVKGEWSDYHPNKMGGQGHEKGRYPANVIFDDVEAEALDREVGELHESTKSTRGDGAIWDNADGETGQEIAFGDSGGPSRYFYTSKASRAERTLNGKIENAHPTVKPVDLMEWLVKLATAKEQIVLDPFAGTGTTCKAAKNLNRKFIGIEQQAKWADVARARVGLTVENPTDLTEDGQTSLTGVSS